MNLRGDTRHCVYLVKFSCPGIGIVIGRQLGLSRIGIFPGNHDEGWEEESDFLMINHNLCWPRREVGTQSG